jgi:hypothetical protein
MKSRDLKCLLGRVRDFGYFPALAPWLAKITADRGGVVANTHCVGALTQHNRRRSSRQMRLTRRSAMVVLAGPATVRHATLHVRAPPNDSSVLALHNVGVAGPRGPSFHECQPVGKRRLRRPKWGWFCLDLRKRHPLSVLYTQVATPANAGTWALGEKSCLFLPCANFPGLAVESMWELLLGLVQGHGGAPAYQNW